MSLRQSSGPFVEIWIGDYFLAEGRLDSFAGGCNGCFFKFGVEVGVEPSIVNALYRLRITDQLFKSYAFTRVVRSQSTLQRLLRRQI
jgi:hypothetical protein